jgi:NADH-quinone oxidoreductase subunit E
MRVFTPELRAEADSIVARYPAGRERSAILPLLYLVQSVEGYVTREGLREVADLLGIRTAEVEAVASFYTMLRLRPTGRHVVAVCTNLSCALRGAKETYAKAHEMLGAGCEDVTEDGGFTLHEEECLGACDAAPVVQLNFANYDRVDADGIARLIDALRAGQRPEPSRGGFPGDFRAASRILAGLEPAETTVHEPATVPPSAEAEVVREQEATG